MILRSLVLSQYQRVTDRRKDRQTRRSRCSIAERGINDAKVVGLTCMALFSFACRSTHSTMKNSVSLSTFSSVHLLAGNVNIYRKSLDRHACWCWNLSLKHCHIMVCCCWFSIHEGVAATLLWTAKKRQKSRRQITRLNNATVPPATDLLTYLFTLEPTTRLQVAYNSTTIDDISVWMLHVYQGRSLSQGVSEPLKYFVSPKLFCRFGIFSEWCFFLQISVTKLVKRWSGNVRSTIRTLRELSDLIITIVTMLVAGYCCWI